jgi:hypothetical protein
MNIDREEIAQIPLWKKLSIVFGIQTIINSYLMTVSSNAIYLWPLTAIVAGSVIFLLVKPDPFYEELKKENVVPEQQQTKKVIRDILWRRPLRKNVVRTIEDHRDLFQRAPPQHKDLRVQKAHEEIIDAFRDAGIELADAQKSRLREIIKQEWKNTRKNDD